MSKGGAPSIFVSSTCYDLKQVRTDIRGFIESLGCEPMLSDFDTFPIDPDLSTVENCLRAVEERADILVLMVGGRYGSTTEQGKSITNLEYIQARAKGIPVYVFVMRSILDVLPVWKANPEGNFQGVVDSPKLFEFVESLMSSKEVWVFPFDIAQDIMQTLRKQLAYLFNDSLQLRIRMKSVDLPESLLSLKGPALRLVIERPAGWEYLLLSQVLSDELALAKNLKRDYEYDIALGTGDDFDLQGLISWTQRKLRQLASNAASINQIFGQVLQDALGPPGVPGNPELIVYVAQKLAEVYKTAILWSLEIRRVHVEEELRNLVRIVSRMPANMIREIEEYSERIFREMREALATPAKPGEVRTLEFILKLTMPGNEEFEEELNRLRRVYHF
ncbi:MAG: DUF4062 domain-containing protein [Anaerolineae bacterium]